MLILLALTACASPEEGGDANGGRDSAAANEDSGGGGSGGGDAPSMLWESWSGSCGGAALELDDVAAGPMAFFLSYELDGAWVLNPAMGMSATLDEGTGRMSIPCGEGNSIPRGSEVRVALGYPAASLPLGAELGFDVHRGECGESPLVLAEELDMGFAGLAFATAGVSGDLALNPPMGMSSFLKEGVLQVDCGSFGNSVPPGSQVYASLAVGSGGEALAWETYEGTCGGGGLGFDARPGAEVVSFQISDDSGEVWSINTGMGMSAVLQPDGRVEVPCGEGNSVPMGSGVRIALGYPP